MKKSPDQPPVQAEPKRVFIVDDHPLIRTGLKQLLDQDSGLEVCGEAERVDEAIPMIEALRPAVVLVDLALPGKNGMELVKHIKSHWLGVKVIVVSTYDETVYAPLATEYGADCYINKHEAMNKIVKAIHAACDPQQGPIVNGSKTSHWFG